jgi:hypothetical protein
MINKHLYTIIDRENIISGYEAECKIQKTKLEELSLMTIWKENKYK